MISILCFISVSIFWGLTWYAFKIQIVTGVPPIQSIGYRCLLSAFIIYIFCKIKKTPVQCTLRDHRLIAIQGLSFYCLNFYCFFIAVRYIPSGMASVIFSTLVFMNVFNNHIFLKTPISSRIIIGGIIGFSGMMFVFYPHLVHFRDNENAFLGLGLGIGATCIASIGNVFIQYHQTPTISLPQRMTLSMLYGGIFSLFISFLQGEPLVFSWTPEYIGALFYLIIFGSIVGLGSYLKLIQTLGSAKAAYTNMINPIIALTVSSFFEGFSWEVWTVVGIGFILSGCVVVLYQKPIKQDISQIRKAA